MIFLTFFFMLANLGCMVFLLWMAFAKVNRPITWHNFYLNLGGAAINLVAVGVNSATFFRLLSIS